MKKVLFVSVHSDDETIGCGGVILRHKKIGDKIFWLIVTNANKLIGWDEKQINRRQNEIQKVAEHYNFEKYFKLDFNAGYLDDVSLRDLIQKLNEVILKIKPQILFLPNRSDVHS